MPFQHIFTNAQIGLSPDSSGYCTVAQTEGIPDDLVKALERLSTYDFSAKNDPHMGGHSPIVYRYQFVRVHSDTFFVISKINDAGDSNYLAQHLALDSSEIGQLQDYPHLNPAFFLLAGKHWKKAWDEIPQILPELDFESLVPGSNKETPYFVESTCENWKNGLLGGQVDQAPTLLEPPYNTKSFLYLPPGQEIELLQLLNETLWLSGIDAWRYSFTTFLQQGESHENYAWCGLSGGNAQQQATTLGQTLWPIAALPKSGNVTLINKALMGHEQVPEEPAATATAPAEIIETPASDKQPIAQSEAPPTTQTPAVNYPKITSPPSVEDFVAVLSQIKPPDKDEKRSKYISNFKFENKCYAKYIKSYIESHLNAFEGEERIETKEKEVDDHIGELASKAKKLKGTSTSNVLMDVCTGIYDPLSGEIEDLKNKEDQPNETPDSVPNESPDSEPDEAPDSVPSSTEIGALLKLHQKKLIAALSVIALAALVFIKFEWIKAKLTGGEDRDHPTDIRFNNNNQASNNEQPENNHTVPEPDSNHTVPEPDNNQTVPEPENNQTVPEPENQNLKATVDKFFGARYVSLFVKEYNVLTPRNQADLLNLTGNQAKLLFESLGKNPSGDPGSMKVWQPGIATNFKDPEWLDIDFNGDASTKDGLDLLHKNKSIGLKITSLPKWGKNIDELENGTSADKRRNAHLAKPFSLEVKQNSAIQTTIGDKNEILYILKRKDNETPYFFPDLFDDAVNKPMDSGLIKLKIDPYLMDKLNNRVYYKGKKDWLLAMVVPERLTKDSKDNFLYLKQKNPDDREWVVYTDDLDTHINLVRNPIPQTKNIVYTGKEPEPGIYEYSMSSFQFPFPKGTKIKFKGDKGVGVVWLKAYNELKSIGNNTFTVEKEIRLGAPFQCRLKYEKNSPPLDQQKIRFSLEYSDKRKDELARPHEVKREKRIELFTETLKVNSILVYYKRPSRGLPVLPVLKFNLSAP